MSNLIRSHKAVTTAPRSPSPTHQSVAIALAQMDHMSINLVGLSQAPMSSASSVAIPVSTMCGHRYPRMPKMPSASTTNALGSQQDEVFGGCLCD
ncbi:hypothetical protein C1H46_016893 [Malus baccata]|uniref:Uncharacterized protein n=1 Tax=Malus baccata TaxID=106549 RepID=A0A540MFY2_MALBA|nr:hypothetical protein C1H46_016893 [Malus baccata]